VQLSTLVSKGDRMSTGDEELSKMAVRDARFSALERMKRDRPPFPEAEVETDIAEAIAAVRAERTRRQANKG
jgi:hypothetical protein